MMKCIDEVPAADLKGKRVLLRASLDLPLDESGNVADEFRLKQCFPTIELLRKAQARIILVGKIGRDPNETMAPVAKAFNKYMPVLFVPDIAGDRAHEAVNAMKDGDIM